MNDEAGRTAPDTTAVERAAERPARRPYRSALRDERAAATRERIVTAARELFASRGFAGTTIAMIAKRAGVATATVYSTFSNKAAIITAMIAGLEAEVDAEEWRARIQAEPDAPSKLDLYASFHREFFSNGRDVLNAALHSASDPSAVELQTQGARNAKEWLEPIVATLADSRQLAPGLTRQQAVDRAWMLSAMELYFRATFWLEWSDEEYEHWLKQILRAQLTAIAP